MNLRFFTFILGLILSVQAQADILFFDFNNAKDERAAAERAAKARGEKLIVLPNISAQAQKEISNASAAYDKIRQEARKAGCDSSSEDSSSCSTLIQKVRAARKDYSKAQDSIRLSPDKADKALKDLAKDKVQISSMVVSGHDGTGHFIGAAGMLSSGDFERLASQNPEVFKNMRGLMLWGCYTGTPGAIEGYWKKAFPNVELIAGYDGRAPLANSPSSSKYLEDVLKKEKVLAQIKDKNELEKNFKQIRDISNVNGALCSGNLFVNKNGVADQAALKQMCQDMPTKQWKDRIECYTNGLPGCENVPADTSQGELRQIYNAVHAVEHCRELAPEKSRGLPSPDSLLRLLFFEDVKKNYLKNQGADVGDLNSILKKLSAPEDLLLPDIEKLSRGELVKKIKDIDNFLAEKEQSMDVLHDPLLAELKEAKSRQKNMAVTLVDMGPICVPFDWVEPGANSKSNCQVTSRDDFAAIAEMDRGEVVRGRISQRISQLVKSDPEYQDAVNKMNLTGSLSKATAYTRDAVKKFAPEISKIVQEQQADLVNQPPIPKTKEKYGGRTEVLKRYEKDENVQFEIESVLYDDFNPQKRTKGTAGATSNADLGYGGMMRGLNQDTDGVAIPAPAAIDRLRGTR